MDVIAVIGLECHAQLRTATKLFCACAVASDAAPNTLVCPVCLGHPGTMPALNAEAVRLGVRAALALGCAVAPTSAFARKHYFYPDLPKGYQITQAERPLATGGAVRGVPLVRVHLEEDAGKLVHDTEGTGVDWNRAGVPLVEIVSAPEVRSPEAAEAYLRTLHRVLVEAGVCTGDLEKGHFRCDANVSVHRPGETWGARVEIKNVNSFRFARQALAFEIERQARLLAAGTPTGAETRAWAGDRTVLLRGKERAEDYRYVPEPDLPTLAIGAELRAAAAEGLAGVPLEAALDAEDAERAAMWTVRYGLAAGEVAELLADGETAAFFEAGVAAGAAPPRMSAWVRSEVARRRNAGALGRLTPAHVARVAGMVADGGITREAARQVLDVLAAEGGAPEAIVAARGLAAGVDEGALEVAVRDVVARFPTEVAKYRAGSAGVFGFLMGQVMAATGRRADPKVAGRVLRAALDEG